MDVSLVDAFDLPDWLGTEPVTWSATGNLEDSALVGGCLTGTAGHHQVLDLLAVDAAYPTRVCPEAERTAAHQAWHYGEVVLISVDGRLAAGVPGTRFDPDLVCETLRRVAKSVAAPSGNYTVAITL
jgi:hypothetical protein